MAYPKDTGVILQRMYPDVDPEEGWRFFKRKDGEFVLEWDVQGIPKPTDTDVIAARVISSRPPAKEERRRARAIKCNGAHCDSDYIRGYRLEKVAEAGGVFRATVGEARIDGKFYVDAGNITTLTGDDVTDGSFAGEPEAFYHVYIYDDGGTRKLYIDKRNGIGDDPQPAFNGALSWKGSIDLQDPERFRLIGYFHTKTSGAVVDFNCAGNGNVRHMMIAYGGKTVSRFFSSPVDVANKWGPIDVSSKYPINAQQMAVSGYLMNETQGVIDDCRFGFCGFEPPGNPTTGISVGAQVDLTPGEYFMISRLLVPNQDRRLWVAGTSTEATLRAHTAGAEICV